MILKSQHFKNLVLHELPDEHDQRNMALIFKLQQF